MGVDSFTFIEEERELMERLERKEKRVRENIKEAEFGEVVAEELVHVTVVYG